MGKVSKRAGRAARHARPPVAAWQQRKATSRAALHAELERQIEAMWALLHMTGRPAENEQFPLVARLYFAGKAAWLAEPPGSRREGFTFEGRRFRWAVTNLGRFKVLDWKTGRLLVQGPPGAVD